MKRLVPFMLLLTLLIGGCSEPLERGKHVREFSFTDQDGKPFHSESLNGTPWIADFIFTNCTTICSTLTSEMADVQKDLKDRGIDVNFVSFSVDPENDTPRALKDYIANFTEDESNWHLLTGYSQQEIEAFAREEFQSFVLKHESSTQVVHGTNFYLLDGEGYIIKEYNFSNESFKEELAADLKRLKH
ncbi:cytochrome c oxidase assembly protein [Sporosarcina sp. P37]|uniref:SCO family protein n=1 Tax=unclassified Sporosarcina TaxID=2647733 RepID=UPI0009C09966|nr:MULTISPECIES: SCO family protein [unclassified Sporosarcina]ARD47298.1 cytochrome c oxidase assembly protein [Sporosarcina sp. P33]ARK23863.1 cytochrome c oxidase assembly protein [Sporosarcina sp. P37]PID17816.1 SCO family protein [Sporosarcina sp. P35]